MSQVKLSNVFKNIKTSFDIVGKIKYIQIKKKIRTFFLKSEFQSESDFFLKSLQKS